MHPEVFNVNILIKGLKEILHPLYKSKYIGDYEKKILSYIITKEPITLYRVAVDLGLSFSTAYKKAYILSDNKLIREIKLKNNGAHYESTVKGLLSCLIYDCNLDINSILNKVRLKWGVSSLKNENILAFLYTVAKLFPNENVINLLDLPSILALMIYGYCGFDINRCLISNGIDGPIVMKAGEVLVHYLLGFFESITGTSGHFIKGDRFSVILDSRGYIVAASCSLCGQGRYCIGEFACSKLYDAIRSYKKLGVRYNNNKIIHY